MAKVSVSVDVPLSPEEAWKHASDLSRYKEWLTIHRVWRSRLPEDLGKGTVVESIVDGPLHPPETMTLNGVGVGGVKVKLIGKVRPGQGDPGNGGAASVVTMDVHLGGPALFGPIGMLVAAALRGDIQESLERFKATFVEG